MTEITLQKLEGSDGLIYFDLRATGLPEHFLGLAADIKFSGDFRGAGYRGMEWGDALAGLQGNSLPINMVKAFADQGKIVAGITFKANDLPVVSDGVLARFVFENDLVSPEGFENQVLSVYDGARRDVPVVDWRVSPEAAAGEDAVALAGSLKAVTAATELTRQAQTMGSASTANGFPAGNTGLQTNIGDDSLLAALNYRVESVDYGWAWGLAGILMLFLGLAGFFVAKIMQKRREKQVSATFSEEIKSVARAMPTGADLA